MMFKKIASKKVEKKEKNLFIADLKYSRVENFAIISSVIKNNRLPNADLVRVLAMLMVILLHTILNFTIRPDFFATKLYFLFEPIIAIAKTCVLLFFMLSGYLVIAKQRSIKDNFNKTWQKILLPLAFFSLVNVVYAWTKFPYNGTNLQDFITSQLQSVVNFPSSPLWFLVVLFFLYLLNPVWQLIFKNAQTKNIAKFVTFLALIFSLLTTIIGFLVNRTDLFFNNFTAWTGFAFFYLYGALAKNKWIKIDKQKINISLLLIGVTFTMVGDYLTMWQKAHSINFIFNDYTGDYLSISVLMTAVALFNILMSLDLSKIKNNVLTWLANLSFGIYLIHTYVISFFTDIAGFDFNKLQINVYLYNFLNVFLVFSISLFMTIVIKKIPKVRNLIGG